MICCILIAIRTRKILDKYVEEITSLDWKKRAAGIRIGYINQTPEDIEREEIIFEYLKHRDKNASEKLKN
jgi:hypothetical protein